MGQLKQAAAVGFGEPRAGASTERSWVVKKVEAGLATVMFVLGVAFAESSVEAQDGTVGNLVQVTCLCAGPGGSGYFPYNFCYPADSAVPNDIFGNAACTEYLKGQGYPSGVGCWTTANQVLLSRNSCIFHGVNPFLIKDEEKEGGVDSSE